MTASPISPRKDSLSDDDSSRQARAPAASRVVSLTTKSRSWAARPRPAPRMVDPEPAASDCRNEGVPPTELLEWPQPSAIQFERSDPNPARLVPSASLGPAWLDGSGSFVSTSSQTKDSTIDSQSFTSIAANGAPSSMLALASTRRAWVQRVDRQRSESPRALVTAPSRPSPLRQNQVAQGPPSSLQLAKRVQLVETSNLQFDFVEDVDPLRTQKVDQALGLVRFLQSIAGTTPVIGTLARSLEVMVGIERVTEDNRDQAGLLFARVVYVLGVIRRLYDSGHWRLDTADQVLAEVSRAVDASTKFFLKYRSQTPLQRRFYSSQNRQRLDLLNQHLGNALTHLSVTLQLETVLRLDSVTTDAIPDDSVDAQVESFIELNGGPAAVQGNPEKICALARLVGVEYSSVHVREISGTYEDLERYLDTVLSTMMGQTSRLEQLDHQVTTLVTRSDAYKDIHCSAIRELWRRAGWGLSVGTQRLTELLMDVVRMEASAARLRGLIHDDVFQVIMDRFPIALGRLDSNHGVQSQGNVTVSELNSFFPWDLSLLDWARVILFVTDDFETQQFHAASQLCQDICDSICMLPPTARLTTFWQLLDSKIATLGDYCLALGDNLFSYMDLQLYFDQLDSAKAALSRVRASLAAPETTWNEYMHALYCRHAGANSIIVHLHLLKELRLLHQLFHHLAESHQPEASVFNRGCPTAPGRDSEGYHVGWDHIEHVTFALGAVCESLDLASMVDISSLAMRSHVWYGWEGMRGGNDWTCNYDFFATTLEMPFPLTAWMPTDSERHPPPNAVVGGTIAGKPVLIVRALVQQAGRHDYVPTFASLDSRGRWNCNAPIDGMAAQATSFAWLTRGRNVHIASSISNPADRILEWVPFSLDEPLHPQAGIMGIEFPHRQTYCARYRFSSDTVLPGKLLLEDGQVHFEVVCPLSASHRGTTTSDTSDDTMILFSTRINPESETTTRRSLPRSGIQLEILLADHDNIFFYRHFEWNTLADAQSRGCQPIIAGGTPANPAYIAWCVAGDKMQFGMVFAGESCAMYGEDASCSGFSTSTFRVLTGKPGKVFRSSVYHPHPLLRWKQVDREIGVVVDNHRSIRAVQVTSTPNQKVVMIARGLATRLVDGRPAHGNRTFCVGQYTQAPGMGGADFEFACSHPDAVVRIEALMFDVSELLQQFPVAMWPWLRAQALRDPSQSGGSAQSMADRRRRVLFDLGIRFDL